jgi:guanylate kinase
MQNGKLIIITAPSGAGKTTIVKYLLQQIPSLAFSVSATTRSIRQNEKDGTDYYFLTVDEFKNKIEKNEFVEWEEVYPGRFYGTLKVEVKRLWDAGKQIIFDVDVMGAMNLQYKFPERTFSIFIKPPSMDVLIERLQKRNTETPQTLETRIERFKLELDYENKFDKVIINDVLETAEHEAYESVMQFIRHV